MCLATVGLFVAMPHGRAERVNAPTRLLRHAEMQRALHVKGGEGHHIAGGIKINRFHAFIDQLNLKRFGCEGG
jgi:hypothetical protein